MGVVEWSQWIRIVDSAQYLSWGGNRIPDMSSGDNKFARVCTTRLATRIEHDDGHLSSLTSERYFYCIYRGADKSLARPGRKQSYSDHTLNLQATQKKNQKVVRPIRSSRQQWPPRRTKNGDLQLFFFSRVGLRTYQHPCRYLLFYASKKSTFAIFSTHLAEICLYLIRYLRWFTCKRSLKANSHIAYHSHAAPMPFPCHAAPLRI